MQKAAFLSDEKKCKGWVHLWLTEWVKNWKRMKQYILNKSIFFAQRKFYNRYFEWYEANKKKLVSEFVTELSLWLSCVRDWVEFVTELTLWLSWVSDWVEFVTEGQTHS